ncbi:unnamed protein product [Bursaphelenchus xylophilus]|uniref:(pine wood nematode) hypothetical protein n=1 Tax=Bursaphelenchus xylophilus TaxID=6326 RepID=A0A1I7SC45_BURXY|nr:unnamed protein product [Bursaphelenchus xylophilus]CAG9125124.1 unnamed protein product [Bursaphelenchus xylophilus]
MNESKVKKHWQKPHQKAGIPHGSVGVLISVEGNEKGAVREFYNLLDAFVDSEKAAGRIYSSKPEVQEEHEGKVDAADELAAACAELSEKKGKNLEKTYIRPKQFPTNVKNLIFFQMPCSVSELYELGSRFIEKCQTMRCCRYVARCVPFENVTSVDLAVLEQEIGKVIERHFGLATDKKDTFNLEFKARCNDKISFEDIIKIVNFHMKNFAPLCKVNLSNPDKSIVVQVINKAVLIGCVNNYVGLRRYSTKPKGSSEVDSDISEEERKMKEKKEEEEKFGDVTKRINELRKIHQEKVEQQKRAQRAINASGDSEHKENRLPGQRRENYDGDRTWKSHQSSTNNTFLEQSQNFSQSDFDRSLADGNLAKFEQTTSEDFKSNGSPILKPNRSQFYPAESPKMAVKEEESVLDDLKFTDFENQFFADVFRGPPRCARGGRRVQMPRDYEIRRNVRERKPRNDGRRENEVTGTLQSSGFDHSGAGYYQNSCVSSANTSDGKYKVEKVHKPPPRPLKPPQYHPDNIKAAILTLEQQMLSPPSGISPQNVALGDGVVYFNSDVQTPVICPARREKRVLKIKTPPKTFKCKYKTEREIAVQECMNYMLDLVVKVNEE